MTDATNPLRSPSSPVPSSEMTAFQKAVDMGDEVVEARVKEMFPPPSRGSEDELGKLLDDFGAIACKVGEERAVRPIRIKELSELGNQIGPARSAIESYVSQLASLKEQQLTREEIDYLDSITPEQFPRIIEKLAALRLLSTSDSEQK